MSHQILFRPFSTALLAAALHPGIAFTQQKPGGTILPANEPTTSAASIQSAAPHGPRKADIAYTDGLLQISANNSSLNQILREIGRLTGMKITGGVQEDRVFGTYGPAPATDVLGRLLEGTSSNLLIVENDQKGPAELILTPRRGGASPPNPNTASNDDNDNTAPQPPPQQSMPVPQQGAFQNNQPGGGPPGASALPPSNGGQTGTPVSGGANLGVTPGAFAGYGQTPPDATAQQNTSQPPAGAPQPGGVSTPQQIYEQLQRLRQQQPQNPTNPQ